MHARVRVGTVVRAYHSKRQIKKFTLYRTRAVCLYLKEKQKFVFGNRAVDESFVVGVRVK